jgi:predicted transposase YbfD/YdcC
MIVAAVIAGQKDMVTIHYWMRQHAEWFEKYLELPNGIPSIHTCRRVLRIINPLQLEKCFIQWVRDIVGEVCKGMVAIDGKTSRGAKDTGQEVSAIHIVSAWFSKNNLTLGEVKTNEKSNEITAIPQLLSLIEIASCVVTIDAAGTQKEIARKIVEDNHADYVLAVKQNQKHMF